jgi:response regulator RpfG family c-di-GMP phosphodiesterase
MDQKDKLTAIERMRMRRSTRPEQELGDRQTIYVVDDERPNLDALKRVLADRYEVTIFENAPSALENIKANGTPDLIITDQRMPGMSGVELLAAVGELFPQSVGLVLSGYTERKDLVGAVNTGRVFAYVTKPWQPESLLGTVSDAIEHSAKKQEQAAITEGLKEIGEQFNDIADLLGADSGDIEDLANKLDEMTSNLELLDG